MLDKLLPEIGEVFALFDKNSLDGFEIEIPGKKGKLVYIGELLRSQNEDTFTKQVKNVLDMHYSDKMTFVGASVVSTNYAVANSIAKVLSEMRTRDRKEVEGQLCALLAAFRAVQ